MQLKEIAEDYLYVCCNTFEYLCSDDLQYNEMLIRHIFGENLKIVNYTSDVQDENFNFKKGYYVQIIDGDIRMFYREGNCASTKYFLVLE